MNRKSKVVVSIVGITIVLLALLGITYAYYLTRIEGNTNTNSISVTTAKLQLIYADNSEEIITSNTALMPDSNNPIGTKTFTVTNNGNDSSYVVIVDNVSITKISDSTVTTFSSNDFRYTLSCTKTNGTKCNDVSNLSIFPTNGGILVSNNIKENDVHTYTLTLWYIDTGLNQSEDMGKSYQARVNITDMTATNPFDTGVSAAENKSLAYNIINNAKENKNGTSLLNTPITKVANELTYSKYTGEYGNIPYYSTEWKLYDTLEELDNYGPSAGILASICTEDMVGKYAFDLDFHEIIGPITGCKNGGLLAYGPKTEYESSLLVEPDDYGTSYYFRGKVEDNFVNFAGMCWRIVRVEGDGSVKIILEDGYAECNDFETSISEEVYRGNWVVEGNYQFSVGDNLLTNFINGEYLNSFKLFQKKLAKKINSNLTDNSSVLEINNALSSKLKIDEWCYDDSVASTNSYECDLDDDWTNESQCTDEYYGAGTRISINKKPSLKCSGTKMVKFNDNTDMYVGAITADEASFAGAYDEDNFNFYLVNPYSYVNANGWWTFSPKYFNEEYNEVYAYMITEGGWLEYSTMNGGSSNYRPTVTLKVGTLISNGDGTQENPYIIG